jgi:hypothetical protein
MTSSNSVVLTTGFVDLATYDELESLMYGGASLCLFRRTIVRSAWFSMIATALNLRGLGQFGGEFSGSLSRTADYSLNLYLRVVLPRIEPIVGVRDPTTGVRVSMQPRWTPNVGHNLIESATLAYNDLNVNVLTSQHLDFWSQFSIVQSKRVGYDNMIGNVDTLMNPYMTLHPALNERPETTASMMTNVITSSEPAALPEYALNIPLPFWFTHEPSNCIINAATPFNDIQCTIKFRALKDLLIVDKVQSDAEVLPDEGQEDAYITEVCLDWPQEFAAKNNFAQLRDARLWGHFVVVPNGDREKIGEELEIDQMIDHVQHLPMRTWDPSDSVSVELRLAHSVRAIFFAVRNATIPSEWSNYSTDHSAAFRYTGTNVLKPKQTRLVLDSIYATDPVEKAELRYENVPRFSNNADYYSLVVPYYFAPAIPTMVGYHVMSYSINLGYVGAFGSTNFARLQSAILHLEASKRATLLGRLDPHNNGCITDKQIKPTYQVHVTASSMTIWRTAGGAGGFPIL